MQVGPLTPKTTHCGIEPAGAQRCPKRVQMTKL
jgi:hypothetical protein